MFIYGFMLFWDILCFSFIYASYTPLLCHAITPFMRQREIILG
jgi:hypothetical protein